MDKDCELGDVVRAWVELALPGQTRLADRAVALAIDSYRAGASIRVACLQVSEFVDCWVQHSAQQAFEGHALVRLAS